MVKASPRVPKGWLRARFWQPPRHNHFAACGAVNAHAGEQILQPCGQLGMAHGAHVRRTQPRACQHNHRLAVLLMGGLAAARGVQAAAAGGAGASVAAVDFERRVSISSTNWL